MLKKLMALILVKIMLPSLAFAWTYTANMDSWPTIGPGFNCYNRTSPNYGESILDSTTPDQRKSLHGYMYPGTNDAREPFMCSVGLPNGTRNFYFQYYFKYGSNWKTHPTLNKHVYFMTDSANHVGGFWGTRTSASRGGGEQFVYAPASVFGLGFQPVNVGTPIALQHNNWYKISGWVDAGDPGMRNARVKLWVNDVLQIDYSGLPLLASDATGINVMEMTPVWGGNQDITVPATGMDIYFDKWIVSSEPISELTSGDAGGGVAGDVKYPNVPSSIKVE
ncbi:MAG: hypothetical protein IH588_10725 [Anaerolineales bacterium]|nr:hypothetical protein [Anaerolineales bacterium]